jgi:6,7-dimethyl-8-ribityllumazine synthase
MTSTHDEHLDAKAIRFALVASRWNDLVVSRLVEGAERFLERHGGKAEHRTLVRVPGSWELPLAASRVAKSGKVDAIVALGALVRGETPHFEVLAAAVAHGLGQVSLETGLPVGFGVLTAESLDQALERAGGKMGNKGEEAAAAALEMVHALRRIG